MSEIELPGKHPAENFVKFLMLRDEGIPDATIMKTLADWGFLLPKPSYLVFLRNDLEVPQNFEPLNRLNRESMKFLRAEGVYEMFHPNLLVEEAWSILKDPMKRSMVEQALLARLDLKVAALKINMRMNWKLDAKAMATFGHFFWNVKLLTFDEWGRFLYGRSAMYERAMALLQGQQQVALHNLHLEQTVESKRMIQRAQEICYFTLEEVSQKPGTSSDKVKAITVLTKGIVECHNALSTSDMAIKDILKNFERFRMEHPQTPARSIHELAPHGNYSGSGAKDDKGGAH